MSKAEKNKKVVKGKLLLSYIERDSPIHRLTGTTKLIGLLLWSISSMYTYDTRVLVVMMFMSFAILKISKIKFKEISFVFYLAMIFLILNNIGIYLFSPEHGTTLYGTRTELAHLFWRYTITSEQLFYQLNITMKYFVVIPVALLFIVTTNPSEFASSLAGVGVSYKIGYSVSLALRYIPDIQRDFMNISKSQQARGIDLSRNEKTITRLKNVSAILLPLVMSSLARIDVISNAMELRSFGKNPKRSWYIMKPFSRGDFIALTFIVTVSILAFVITFQNETRFFNPFI